MIKERWETKGNVTGAICIFVVVDIMIYVEILNIKKVYKCLFLYINFVKITGSSYVSYIKS